MNAKINKNRSGILKMLAFCSFPTLEERALWELRSRSAVCGYGNTWDKALYQGKQLWSKGSGGCGASRQQMESYTGSKIGDSALEKDTHSKEQGSKLRYSNVDNSNRLSRYQCSLERPPLIPARMGAPGDTVTSHFLQIFHLAVSWAWKPRVHYLSLWVRNHI